MTRPRAELENGVALITWPDTGERERLAPAEAEAVGAELTELLASRLKQADGDVVPITLTRRFSDPYVAELTLGNVRDFAIEVRVAVIGAKAHRPPPASRLPYTEDPTP